MPLYMSGLYTSYCCGLGKTTVFHDSAKDFVEMVLCLTLYFNVEANVVILY